MLDHDVVDQSGELETVASTELDRPSVHDQAHRAPTLLDPGQRDRVEVESVGRLGRRHLFDRELDLGQLVPPAPLEVLDRVEDQIVEALGAAAIPWNHRQSERAARATTAAVAAAPRTSAALRPGTPVQGSEHAASVDGAASLVQTSATRARGPANPGPRPLRGVASNAVRPVRRCSRAACGLPAVATLTYVYSDSTAVLGPLATYAEPHCYDLCARHSERLTAPRGWEVIRLAPDPDALEPTHDDLEALANAVREAAQAPLDPEPIGAGVEVGRRGHLRVLRSEPDPPTD